MSGDEMILGLKIAAAIAAALWFLTIAIDLWEDFRAARQAAREADRLARLRAIKDEAHYDLSLRMASQVGSPWPPPRRS